MPRQNTEPYRVTREGAGGAVYLAEADVAELVFLSDELSRDMALVHLMRLPSHGVAALDRVAKGLKLLR